MQQETSRELTNVTIVLYENNLVYCETTNKKSKRQGRAATMINDDGGDDGDDNKDDPAATKSDTTRLRVLKRNTF